MTTSIATTTATTSQHRHRHRLHAPSTLYTNLPAWLVSLRTVPRGAWSADRASRSGTPAASAGLQPGDLILRFGGRRVQDFPALQSMVRDEQPGNRVKMIVRREKDTLEIELIIGKRTD